MAAYGCLVAGQSLWVRVLTAVYRLHGRPVCDKSAAAVYSLWCYISVTCLCIWLTVGASGSCR